MALLFGLAIAGGTCLLLLSIYPGMLSDLLVVGVISSPFWLPVVCIGAVVYLDVFNTIPDLSKPPLVRRRWLPISVITLLLIVALLGARMPQRLAFLVSRPAFRPLVTAAPVVYSGGQTLGRTLGMYHVDHFAADPRGGVYFRTHQGMDGFSLSRKSFGFAHKPNVTGSPFGNANYRVTHLVGDWYCFAAEDEGG